MKKDKRIQVDTSKRTSLQIIFSTESDGQFVANVPIEIVNLTTKESCLECLTNLFYGKFSFLPDSWEKFALEVYNNEGIYIHKKLNDVPILCKISMCINYYGNEPETPEWYTKNNGKIYLNQINNQ